MLRWALLSLLLLAPFSEAAAAQPSAESPPDWLRKPTLDEFMAVYPVAWAKTGKGGSAEISCTVTIQGVLRDCKVTKEDPPGVGFGEAALALSKFFTFKPRMSNGAPAEAQIHIPLVWRGSSPSDSSELGTRLPGRTGPPHDRIVSNVVWVQAPSVADVMAAYPAKARAERATGHVTFDCIVGRAGRLGSCRSLTEAPGAFGFSGAARNLVSKFVSPTEDSSGQSLVGAHTQVVVTFASEALDNPVPIIGKPQWTAMPTAEEFNAAFPSAAAKAAVLNARVILNCAVLEGGRLSDCRTQSEEPGGYGFAESAMALAGKLRVNTWTSEGLPVIGGRVSAPIRWALTQAPQPVAVSGAGGGKP